MLLLIAARSSNCLKTRLHHRCSLTKFTCFYCLELFIKLKFNQECFLVNFAHFSSMPIYEKEDSAEGALLRVFLACHFIKNHLAQVFSCEFRAFFWPGTLPKIRFQHVCFLVNFLKFFSHFTSYFATLLKTRLWYSQSGHMTELCCECSLELNACFYHTTYIYV